MINHGISTGALFALVGMIYDRYHTRNIADFGGLARRLPRLAFFLVLFTLSSIGLPGTEWLCRRILDSAGMFQRGWSQSPAGLNWELLAIAVLAVFGRRAGGLVHAVAGAAHAVRTAARAGESADVDVDRTANAAGPRHALRLTSPAHGHAAGDPRSI